MKLTTTSFVEHQSSGSQDIASAFTGDFEMLVPGGTTTCLGCTCTSCCCAALTAMPNAE